MADTWLTIEQAAVTLNLSVRTINRHINAGKLQSRLHEGRREVLVSLPTPAADTRASDERETFDEPPERTDRSERSDKWADRPEPVSVRGVGVGSGGATPFSAEQVSASAEPMENQPNFVFGGPGGAPVGHVGIEAETMLALADQAADKVDLAISAFQTLARTAENQRANSQKSARFAWAAVSVMIFGVIGAVGWTSHYLTKTTVENLDLHNKLSDAQTTLRSVTEQSQTQQDKLGTQLDKTGEELTRTREELAHLKGQLEGAALAEARAAATSRPSLAVTPAPAPSPSPTPAPSPAPASGAPGAVAAAAQIPSANPSAVPAPATQPGVRTPAGGNVHPFTQPTYPPSAPQRNMGLVGTRDRD